MHSTHRKDPGVLVAFSIFELIFHAAVRSIRKSHGNAIIGLMINIAQTLALVLVFYVVFAFFGLRGAGLRGDFLLYLMTGVFLFMCHVKTLTSVVGSEGPTSPMMKHAPMNTIIAIGGAALGELYVQVLSLFVILFLYHAIWTPLEVHQPAPAFAMLLVAWFAGVALGMVLLALKPWAPNAVKLMTQVYTRFNMIASGKMFVANILPASFLPYFTWNPLFHLIDQARGFTFNDYNPFNTWLMYPVWFALVVILVGLMGEFYTRRMVSLSRTARQ